MTSKGDVHVVVGPKVESTGWYRTSLDMHFKLVKQEIRVHIRIFSPSGTTTPRSFHVVARHLWEPRAGTAAKIWKLQRLLPGTDATNAWCYMLRMLHCYITHLSKPVRREPLCRTPLWGPYAGPQENARVTKCSETTLEYVGLYLGS